MQVRHAKISNVVDAGDGRVSSTAWNEEHAFTGTPGTVVGFDGSGNATELDQSAVAASAYVANRTALAALATTNNAAYLREAGREGVFVWSSSDLSAKVSADTQQGLYVAPASDTTGTSGAWVRKVAFGIADFRWFGAVADCVAVGSGTTNTAIFDAARTACIAAGIHHLHIPSQPAAYRFATAPAAIHDHIRITGDGFSSNPGQVGATTYVGIAIWNGTVLCFDADTAGFTFYAYTDNNANATAFEYQSADRSSLEQLILHGGLGTGITSHGIYTRARLNVRNVMVYQFAGCGLKIEAYDSGASPYGSVDSNHLDSLTSRSNRLHGVQVVGRDCNVNTFTNLDCAANGGVGLLDDSLLANVYQTPHFSGNNFSHPTNGGTTSVAQRNQVLADCAELSDNLLGSFVMKNANAANVLTGLYIEVGFGARYIMLPPSTIVGGLGASNTSAYRSSDSGTGGVLSYTNSGMALVNIDTLYSTGTTTTPTNTITAIAGTFKVRGYNAYSTISVVSDGASQGLQLYNSTNGLKDGLDILAVADQTFYNCQQHVFRQGTGYGSTVYFSHQGSHFDIATGDLTMAGTQVINSSGRLQAVGMPALTGDVTTAGGALATTIANGAVTLAKQANMATASVVYRKTAGSGAPEVQTLATLKTDLGLTGTNSGDQTITLTGAVTGTGTGSFATSLTAASVVSAVAAQALAPASVAATGAVTSSSASAGMGYATGAGGAVSQLTSRTTGVTVSKLCGAITLFSAAGSATWNTFTVTNTSVAATDVIEVCQKSGANLYSVLVTAVGSGSFNMSVSAVSGTATEAPVINFIVHKAVAA